MVYRACYRHFPGLFLKKQHFIKGKTLGKESKNFFHVNSLSIHFFINKISIVSIFPAYLMELFWESNEITIPKHYKSCKVPLLVKMYHHFYREAFCYINKAWLLFLLWHDHNRIDDYCISFLEMLKQATPNLVI